MEISLSQSEFISHELITLAVRVSLRFSLFASLVVQSYWEDWHNSWRDAEDTHLLEDPTEITNQD